MKHEQESVAGGPEVKVRPCVPNGESSPTMTPAGAALLGNARASSASVSVVRGLVEAVQHAGVERERFASAAGIQLDQLGGAEARMPIVEIQRLCELAIQLSEDPMLGLHWADRLTERIFVPVSHLIAHSQSLRQGLTLLAQFFPLLCDHAAYRIFESADEVILQRVPVPGESAAFARFSSEMMVGGFWRLIGSFNTSVSGCLSFAHAQPAEHAEYTRFFGRAVWFGQPFSGIVFDRKLLDAPSPQPDDGVLTALQEVAERRMQRISGNAPYAVRVRDLLVQGFREGTEMERIARGLDMSARTLRRHLLAEGRSYSELVNEALGLVATHLLRDERRTIQEVGYELGFSEMSAFYRAFKRWTGMTPGAWREAQRG